MFFYPLSAFRYSLKERSFENNRYFVLKAEE